MSKQKIMKLFFPTLLTLCITLNVVANESRVERPINSVSLSDFLDVISQKHHVFFTYNPQVIVGANLNPDEYQYGSLAEIIYKLELKTNFDFEYLGQKYYAVKPKKVERILPNKVNVVSQSDFSTATDFSALQNSISGTIVDQSGVPLAGVNIIEKGTTNGTTTDFDGNYIITASEGATLVFSYIGFNTVEKVVSGATLNVTMEEGITLNEVVMIGNRSKPRTVLTSAVPVDNVGVAELASTGQPTVDKMLTYKIPSFNSSNQTTSDATAHFDPADLRGLGPSRTLVLVNGKRKNQSALVYINDTPGKGEVGVDLKSIPAAAIERIEVLRDGASAQYGSDAIAGIINMILKKDVTYTTVSAKTGITTEGDGFNYGFDINSGIKLSENGGYLNLTGAYYEQEITDRAGEPGEDVLFGVLANDPTWGQWLSDNPDLGMTLGQPESKNINLNYNASVPFNNDKGEFYTFGGLTYRVGKSFALYRTPYWVQDPFNLLHEPGTTYNGFQPTFETDIRDNNITFGVKTILFGFATDISGTQGRNAVDYTVDNSINPSLGASSPTNFDVGAYTFGNLIGNLDFSRSFGNISTSFGAEIRKERFTAEAGQEASYVGGGVQSFPGLQPSNVVEATRNNFGVYGDVEWDINEQLLVSGALRYEDFSDFGDNTSWKVSGRYLLNEEKGTIRGSYSTGFRAPSLHQIYLSNVQTLVSGGTISNQGTFNNVDPIIREGLGVPQLTAETSKNISAGFTYRPLSNLSFSIDYYNVRMDDRVLFTGEIGFDGDATTTNPVETILTNNDITSLKFFVNAVNTVTNGVDFVTNYRNIELGAGKVNLTLSANFNDTKIVDDIATPALLAQSGYEIFNRKEQARITSARPRSKVLLGLEYNLNRLTLGLNNTYFGQVTWQHATDVDKDQTFGGKVVTDLNIGYDFSDKVNVYVIANNLFNVYPDEIDTKGDVVTDLGGRFRYPWEVNQFGFNGTILSAGVNFKF